MKFERVLSILVSLLGAENVSAATLAERFGVSLRTIYRDVRSLEEAGVPVVSRQGRGGGIDIMEGFTLSRHLLTPEEADRLNAALKGLLRVLPDSHTASSAAKIDQLRRSEAKRGAAQTDALPSDYFYFDMTPWTALDLEAIPLQHIYDYCRRRMVLSIAYRDNKGDTSRRDIEPMTLVYRGSSWYLFAWCRMRSDYRIFRLGAIETLVPAGPRFQRRPDSYETVVKDREDNEARVPVLIRFDAEAAHAVGESRHATVLEHGADGAITAEVRLRREDVMPYCSSWGSRIEVLAPGNIRQAMIADARARLSRYDPHV